MLASAPRFASLALAALLVACGARTALDEPPPCEEDSDCPALAFCGPVPRCFDGTCGLDSPRDCDDGMACTEDVCDPVAELCRHAIRDRDLDGFADGSCGGDDCDDLDPAIHPGVRERCAGGRDDECDGATDCSDPDCAAAPECVTCLPEVCASGRDEDCDELVDCDDADCVGEPTCCLDRELDCEDTLDEDCDGAADCLDEDCAGVPSCCVATDEVCNGLDDDCDGAPDDGLACFFLDGEPIGAIVTEGCGDEWYRYDRPDRASANPVPNVRRPDAVLVAVHAGPAGCGASVAVIADATRDGDGGRLTGAFSIEPPTAGGVRVSDDRFECEYDEAVGRGSCTWRWEPCCTDGVLLGDFREDFCVTLTLSEPSGVGELVVYVDETSDVPRAFGRAFEVCGQLRPPVP